MCRLNNQKGIVLVVTLLVVALLTAMVVEFAYGVYTGTNDLYNWRDGQRLSLMAKSGVNVSAKVLFNKDLTSQYTEPVEMPVENPFEDFQGTVIIRIENEDAKFNMNAIVPRNDNIDEDNPDSPYNCFIRLLKALKLDVTIADRVVDWIDTDSESRLADSEAGAKNAAFNSVDELLLIHGISRKDYDTLLPYVTVSKYRDNLIVNVNGAQSPVLQSLSSSPEITEELAKQIIIARKSNPLTIAKFNEIAGTSLGTQRIATEGTTFSIRATASSGGVKRIIETVLDTEHNTIQYWKEY
jgi:general secretion pathway protein K